MRLYHTTTEEAAQAIVSGGFRDATGFYMLSIELTGVWFADRPLGPDEGAAGSPELGAPVLVIELDEAEIADYEVIEEEKPYREWCIPAELANRSKVTVLHIDDDDDYPDDDRFSPSEEESGQ